MIWAKAFATWGAMLIAMICNGFARDALLQARFGELRANQISVLTGSIALLAITVLCWRWIGATSAGMAWGIGILWLGLTLTFEFGFMHFIAGASWEKLSSEYNVMQGRLWPVVLATLLVAPQIARWWRGP